MKIQLLKDLHLDNVEWKFLLPIFIINVTCNSFIYLIEMISFKYFFILKFLADLVFLLRGLYRSSIPEEKKIKDENYFNSFILMRPSLK